MTTSLKTPTDVLKLVEVPQQKIFNGVAFPLFISPALSSVNNLADVVGTHKPWVEAKLREAGAVLFRGFNVPTASDFNDVVKSFGYEAFPFSGLAAPRSHVIDHIYTSNDSPPHYHVHFHNEIAYHAVHCKELPGFKYRHDLVRDVLCDVFKRAGISAKKEAPVSFLTDPREGRSTLRPADVLVFGWVGGKHACIDLTGVSPLVGLDNGPFVVGKAALKAPSLKVANHERACLENQHVFLPFAFDTFGFLAPDAVEILKRVQRVMHGNIVSPRSSNVVF